MILFSIRSNRTIAGISNSFGPVAWISHIRPHQPHRPTLHPRSGAARSVVCVLDWLLCDCAAHSTCFSMCIYFTPDPMHFPEQSEQSQYVAWSGSVQHMQLVACSSHSGTMLHAASAPICAHSMSDPEYVLEQLVWYHATCTHFSHAHSVHGAFFVCSGMLLGVGAIMPGPSPAS